MTKFFLQIMGLGLLFGLLINQASAQDVQAPGNEQTVYISDDLYTFIHAGPGRNYRIIGSVVAGTPVTLLQRNDEEGFVEIIDDKERTGWVDNRFISATPSVRESVPQLEEALQQAQSDVAQTREQNDLLNQQILDLSSRNEQLQSRLQEIQQQHSDVQQELASIDNKVQIEWLTRGGIIGLGGIILGVILMLIPRKRRRNDNWM
ncbi:TIGR04211 family SH3 domain-containing protein [Lacimicrobium alkaliphilum]|uniref:Arylsulfatase n=1 Tax=Lacimicrobium alkaliphilum TaxID=1526571 RepID=A0ABQ1QWI9_9ALTE|nr:TIGR04211 family SH3 domain-containing protein [Lacimicrobium alkaliphilum]GGD49864.1 arylsulfatase [Lacimicrobium alkaliphilum]